MHAGHALGRKHCEVVIRFVMKRDAKLPRPYPGVEEMADAKDLSIAWPYNRVTNNLSLFVVFLCNECPDFLIIDISNSSRSTRLKDHPME
jgi:hypothetical protein